MKESEPTLEPVELTSCCPPVGEPLDAADAATLAGLFKALSDPIRLRLFALIATRPGQTCVCDLLDCFEVSQPTISHHLKTLRAAGLVDCERRGTWVYYWALPQALARVRGFVDLTTAAAPVGSVEVR